MQTLSGKSKEDTALFVLFTGFMQKFCWDIPRDFIPIKKDKVLSRTNKEMRDAASYLAKAELGLGLDSAKIEQAFINIKNWKFYFVKNLQDKPNNNLVDECLTKRLNFALYTLLPKSVNELKTIMIQGQYLSRTFGKNYSIDIKINVLNKVCKEEGFNFSQLLEKAKCTHPNNKEHLLNEDGARLLADNIFKNYYNSEITAYRESGVTEYFAREAGPVEFGESMNSAEHLPRQFAEVPTGEFYETAEDEHASMWKIPGTDDENTTESEYGTHIVVDWDERNDKYFDLRRELLHSKTTEATQKILTKAQNLAKTDVISEWMYSKLKYFANDIMAYRIKAKNNRLSNKQEESTL